jgi:hypothetical protein
MIGLHSGGKVAKAFAMSYHVDRTQFHTALNVYDGSFITDHEDDDDNK